jgi:CHAT domain-containing protein
MNTLQASLLQQKADVGQNLQQLYDVLLRPADEQINGRTKLVVVPDGMLWKVPFAALQPNADRYVIDQQAVSYAPSLSALREFGKPRRGAPSVGLFAEANPILPTQLSERMKLSYKDIHFESSTEQVNEMNALATAYPVSKRLTLTGASASEEALKRNPGRPSIMHLAAPALLDDASPMSSFIGLSAASSDDGFLQTREILNMESPARLAILSRVSHLGDYSTAQVCMTWSWFVAGTPALMINSWEVQSLPTTIFMKEFHMGLQNPRLSKAAALQQSALLLRRSTEYSHPFYWSGFVLMGK